MRKPARLAASPPADALPLDCCLGKSRRLPDGTFGPGRTVEEVFPIRHLYSPAVDD